MSPAMSRARLEDRSAGIVAPPRVYLRVSRVPLQFVFLRSLTRRDSALSRRCRKTRQQLGPRKILVLSLVLWLNSLRKMSCARSLAARETLEALRVQRTVQCVSGTLLMNYMTRACPWRVTIPKLNARTHARRRPTNPLHRDLLELLLEAELVGVAALLLAAVHGAGVETSVAPGESGGGEKLEGERRVRDVQGHCRAEQCENPEWPSDGGRQPPRGKVKGLGWIAVGSVFRLERTEDPSRQTFWPFWFVSRPSKRTSAARRGRRRASGRVRLRRGGLIRGYALAADHLVLVVLAGKHEEGGLDDTTTETEHKVKGGLLLDVVVREGAAVLKLLAREDQALLVRGDALLVLNLSLHVVDGVRRLHLKGDGLTRDCDYEEMRWKARQCRASVERRGEGAEATLRKIHARSVESGPRGRVPRTPNETSGTPRRRRFRARTSRGASTMSSRRHRASSAPRERRDALVPVVARA